jgi:hypothetical protein
MVLTTEGELRRALQKGRLLPWALFGAAALSGALGLSIAAVLGAAAHTTLGHALAWLLGLGSLACAASLTWVGRSSLERTRRVRHFEIEQRVVGLAYQNQGRLEAQAVADALPMTFAAAEAFLTELTRSGRARLEVSEQGRITYVFADARPTRGIRVRGKDGTGSHRIDN